VAVVQRRSIQTAVILANLLLLLNIFIDRSPSIMQLSLLPY